MQVECAPGAFGPQRHLESVLIHVCRLVTMQRDSSVGGAEAEEARQLADLGAVARQAAATLAALQTTASALDEVEEAAAAVERAKGHANEQVCNCSTLCVVSVNSQWQCLPAAAHNRQS